MKKQNHFNPSNGAEWFYVVPNFGTCVIPGFLAFLGDLQINYMSIYNSKVIDALFYS